MIKSKIHEFMASHFWHMKLFFAAAAAMAVAVVSVSPLDSLADKAEYEAKQAGQTMCSSHGSYAAGICEVSTSEPACLRVQAGQQASAITPRPAVPAFSSSRAFLSLTSPHSSCCCPSLPSPTARHDSRSVLPCCTTRPVRQRLPRHGLQQGVPRSRFRRCEGVRMPH